MLPLFANVGHDQGKRAKTENGEALPALHFRRPVLPLTSVSRCWGGGCLVLHSKRIGV